MTSPRITAASPSEEEARPAAWADEWVLGALSTTPADRARVEHGLRRSYEIAGLLWPDQVVWVDSPLVLAYAGPTASLLLDGEPYPDRYEVQDTLANQVDLLREAHPEAVPAHASFALGHTAFERPSPRQSPGEASWTIVEAVGRETNEGVHRQIGDAVGRAIRASLGALDDDLVDALRGVVHRVTGTHGPRRPSPAHRDWLLWAHRRFHCRLRCPHCEDAYRVEADVGTEEYARQSAVWGMDWASSLEFPLYDARKAPFMGGRGPALASLAGLAFHRDTHTLPPASSDRLQAFVDASSAGWWWPDARFVLVTDRPSAVHHETVGPRHRRYRQLHRAGGPAVEYRDGWRLWYWHGFQVPQWAVEEPAIERIAAEPNIEVRRCAIESMGWDRFAAEARLRRVAAVPDPSNPSHFIVLYDVPERLWGARVRLALVTNGSAERDGTVRRYGLTVPAAIDDPVEAVAWTYNVSREIYASIVRRT